MELDKMVYLYTMVYLCPQKLRQSSNYCQPPSNIITDASASKWPDF